jgi:hypothetical protein
MEIYPTPLIRHSDGHWLYMGHATPISLTSLQLVMSVNHKENEANEQVNPGIDHRRSQVGRAVGPLVSCEANERE